MRGKPTLYRDQYGRVLFARTVKELRTQVGGGRVSKMYIDKIDGRTMHVGYIVGAFWFTAYQAVEIPA